MSFRCWGHKYAYDLAPAFEELLAREGTWPAAGIQEYSAQDTLGHKGGKSHFSLGCGSGWILRVRRSFQKEATQWSLRIWGGLSGQGWLSRGSGHQPRSKLFGSPKGHASVWKSHWDWWGRSRKLQRRVLVSHGFQRCPSEA